MNIIIVLNTIMLEEKDIQKIGEEVGRVIEQNINPQFDEIRGRLDKIEAIMVTKDELNNKIGRIEAEMVTKSYLDDKLADLDGNLVVKLRKEDGKINRLIEILKSKSMLTEDEVAQFKDFQVFPRV